MRLFANTCHAPRHAHILVFAERAAEGVTRERRGIGSLPGQDHSGVQSSCQGHPDLLVSREIARKISRENFAEFPIIGFWIELFLGFPLPWMEIVALAL